MCRKWNIKKTFHRLKKFCCRHYWISALYGNCIQGVKYFLKIKIFLNMRIHLLFILNWNFAQKYKLIQQLRRVCTILWLFCNTLYTGLIFIFYKELNLYSTVHETLKFSFHILYIPFKENFYNIKIK